MGYAPVPVPLIDIPIALKPALGGEKRVYISMGLPTKLGTFFITGADTGTWTPEAGVTTPTGGFDILAMVATVSGIRGGVSNVIVTATGIDTLDAALSQACTLAPVSYAPNAAKVYPVSAAYDGVPSPASKQFKGGVALNTAITGVTVDCDATAIYGEVVLWAIPNGTTYPFSEVPGVDDFSFSDKTAQPLSIPQGLDGSRWKKLGRSAQGDFSFTTKKIGVSLDATQFAGVELTVRIDTLKEGRVLADRTYLLGASYGVKHSSPDGDGVATLSCSGIYTHALLYVPVAGS
jgi:hypothetical protein